MSYLDITEINLFYECILKEIVGQNMLLHLFTSQYVGAPPRKKNMSPCCSCVVIISRLHKLQDYNLIPHGQNFKQQVFCHNIQPPRPP